MTDEIPTKYQIAVMLVGVLKHQNVPVLIKDMNNGKVFLNKTQIDEAIEVLEDANRLLVNEDGTIILTESGRTMDVNEAFRIQ